MSLAAGWLGLVAAKDRRHGGIPGHRYVVSALCLLVAADATYYHFAQARAWRVPSTLQMEVLAYGSGLAASGQGDVSRLRRPERFLLGTSPEEALGDARNLAYNRCWYTGTFCVLGYTTSNCPPPTRSSTVPSCRSVAPPPRVRKAAAAAFVPAAGQTRACPGSLRRQHRVRRDWTRAGRCRVEFIEYLPAARCIGSKRTRLRRLSKTRSGGRDGPSAIAPRIIAASLAKPCRRRRDCAPGRWRRALGAWLYTMKTQRPGSGRSCACWDCCWQGSWS